uniref:GH06479p n=1 Tax=Drosophila melanogaster TaxID=7227 RepID=Q95TB6_DROME|nr:GH06479p [Drosophila melanogaster]
MRASASMVISIWPALRRPPSETLWLPMRSRLWTNKAINRAARTDNIECPGVKCLLPDGAAVCFNAFGHGHI